MPAIELSLDDKNTIVRELQRFLESEHGLDLGKFDVEFVLDHVTTLAGPFWYNRGLADAHAVFRTKLD
ncbi:DUF2164 domain-containing protein, partial [Aphanothece microscopica]|uniref:DUF2164 domain-containing protein n=1 Tax=Aphanothece microscopica TaxID=1049561 RepID=UPI0039848932